MLSGKSQNPVVKDLMIVACVILMSESMLFIDTDVDSYNSTCHAEFADVLLKN